MRLGSLERLLGIYPSPEPDRGPSIPDRKGREGRDGGMAGEREEREGMEVCVSWWISE
jgi:hypothetical protein